MTSHQSSSLMRQAPSESENAIFSFCGIPYQALALHTGPGASYNRRQKMSPSARCPEPRSDLGAAGPRPLRLQRHHLH